MQQRNISIEEAFAIVRRAHEAMGWSPNASTTREQRNAWFEAAVAAVHYGHPVFNPAGGDRDWMIKSAGGGRPQSDDIIVRASTREYFDLIGGTGTDQYRWGIGRHGEPLPSNQEVYPPSRASLGEFPWPADPPVVDPGEPQPEPEPPPPGDGQGIDDLAGLLMSIVETQANIINALTQIATVTADIGRRQVADSQRSEVLFDRLTKRLFGILEEEDGRVQPGLPQATATLVRENLDANPIVAKLRFR